MSKPYVFIVESLGFDDERRGRMEGRILRQILKLSEKKATYVHIRTSKELQVVLGQFQESGMRYLHLSCHGSPTSVALTLDRLSFDEFAGYARPFLQGRRLFMSACAVVNDELARAIIPDSGCLSVVGPATDITFGDAALMWASFYHLVFRMNPGAMDMGTIRSALQQTHRTFGVKFRYFSSSKSAGSGYKERLVG